MPVFRTFSYNATLFENRLRNRTCNNKVKMKTYPNHLEIITSAYKDFDLEDFLDVIMNAPVCMCPTP